MPEAPLPELPPALAARYTPLRVLGAGAMGVVLEAYEAALKRTVALKLIREPLIDDVGRAYFAREVHVLTGLAHPGVVRLLDGDVAGDLPWLAMARLDGRTLAEHLTEHRPSLDELAGWLDGVLDALAYVHAHAIVHRDVKPSNVFLRGDGAPVLIDFGLVSSTEFPKLTQTGVVLGTPRYLAPEVVTGSRPTFSTDLFAVGVLGLESATGQRMHLRPGEHAGVDAVLNAAANRTYVPIAQDLARPLGPVGEVLLRAVDPDPERRYPDAASMRSALAGALAAKSRSTRRKTRQAGSRAAGPVARLAVPAVALGVALAAVAAIVGSRGGEVKAPVRVAAGTSPSPADALEVLRARLLADQGDLAAAVAAGHGRAREAAIARAIGRLAEARELPYTLRVAPEIERGVLYRLDALVRSARSAAHAHLEHFDDWKRRHESSIEHAAMTTRQKKRVYLEERRAKGHGPAQDAAARRIREAFGQIAPLARAGFALTASPTGGTQLAGLLTEVRQDAAHFEALPEAAIKNTMRSWTEGRPSTWVRHLFHAHELHFARESAARAVAVERALEAFERAHGAAPVTHDDAYLVGSLIQYQLDALRWRTIDEATAGRLRELWWRWRSRAPDDPRLAVFDAELKALPAR